MNGQGPPFLFFLLLFFLLKGDGSNQNRFGQFNKIVTRLKGGQSEWASTHFNSLICDHVGSAFVKSRQVEGEKKRKAQWLRKLKALHMEHANRQNLCKWENQLDHLKYGKCFHHLLVLCLFTLLSNGGPTSPVCRKEMGANAQSEIKVSLSHSHRPSLFLPFQAFWL